VRRLAGIRAQLRQRRHHREFRITAPPADEVLWEQLAAVPADVVEEPAVPQLDEKLLADAATNLWRAQRRLARDGGPATARDRQAGRYLLTCREALTDAGMVIQDHDGDAFHPGRSIEVLTFQADPALAGEIVLETVRPTIYLRERRIQTGQVIVAGPPPEPSSED
jgi:hypothetical protein